jgi:hypothetical protein
VGRSFVRANHEQEELSRSRILPLRVPMMRWSRILWFAAFPALLVGGCAFLTGGPSDPFLGGATEEAYTFRLRIDNGTRFDARVQIIWGASARSLGTIQAGEGETFRLPLEGRGFRLQVDYLDGPGGYETRPIPAVPDQFVRYRIPS